MSVTWEDVLDSFEQSASASEPDTEGFALPEYPLPEHLRERAQTVMQRLDARAAEVRAHMSEVAAQIRATDMVPKTRGDAPVFIDIDG